MSQYTLLPARKAINSIIVIILTKVEIGIKKYKANKETVSMIIIIRKEITFLILKTS